MSQCAPCHLPGIDPSIDTRLADPTYDTLCEVCGSPHHTDSDVMLLCDVCDNGWHLKCLQPPLDAVPDGDWLCPRCAADGVTPEQLRASVQQREAQQQQETAPNLYPNRQMRERDAAARLLHGRLVLKPFYVPGTRRARPYWGRVHFMGDEHRPKYFHVYYEDGDMHESRLADIEPHLQPADTALPAGVHLPNDEAFTGQAVADACC
jgi:hypothetical protein